MERRVEIVEAMFRLLADRPYEAVSLRQIAHEAGVSLSVLAAHFATRAEILMAHSRTVDEAVLAASYDDMDDQPPRERLFDVLMTRIETLRPHREAIGSLMRSARKDPQLALFLNAQQLVSMRWMLEAASIAPKGWRGRAALQALSVSFVRVLTVFVSEDDVGMPRTMATLDKELRTAEARYLRLSRLFGRALDAAPAADASDGSQVVNGGLNATGSVDVATAAPTPAAEGPPPAPSVVDDVPLDPPTSSEDDGKVA